MTDLDDPTLLREYYSPTKVTDHNLYVAGTRMYMSNNRSGLRVVDVSDPADPREIGFFDTTPWSEDAAGFDGTWSVYPYFESGVILLSSRREGLFLVKPRDERLVPYEEGPAAPGAKKGHGAHTSARARACHSVFEDRLDPGNRAMTRSLAAAVGIVAVACNGGPTLPATAPTTDGVVVTWDVPIPGGDGNFFVRVRADPSCVLEIHIVPRTEFALRTAAGQLREATFMDLEVGMRIRIWTIDPVECPGNGVAEAAELRPE